MTDTKPAPVPTVTYRGKATDASPLPVDGFPHPLVVGEPLTMTPEFLGSIGKTVEEVQDIFTFLNAGRTSDLFALDNFPKPKKSAAGDTTKE